MVATFTLHRSEVVAHSINAASLLDGRVLQASSRARGRFEGFASRTNSSYRPLGVPINMERITEINASKLDKVRAANQRVEQPLKQSQKKSESEEKARADWTGVPSDANEGDPEELHLQGISQATAQAQSPNKSQGLLGEHRSRHRADGFEILHKSLKEADQRVRSSKADCGAAPPSKDVEAMLQSILPNRDLYPVLRPQSALDRPLQNTTDSAASRDADAANPGKQVLVQSARGPAGSREAFQQPLSARGPRWQPSSDRNSAGASLRVPALSEVLAGGSSLGTGDALPALPSPSHAVASVNDRNDRSAPSRLREQINELLGMPKGTVLRSGLASDEAGAGRKGRLDVRRKLEKQFNDAWSNKAIGKRLGTIADNKDVEDSRKLGLGEDGEPLETGKDQLGVPISEADRAPSAGSGAEASGNSIVTGGNAIPSPVAGVEKEGALSPDFAERRKRERDLRDESSAATKALAQLKEPDSHASPVSRLRLVLRSYQDCREKSHGILQEKLSVLTTSRPHGIAPRPRDNNRQQRWYRDLLQQAQRLATNNELPSAAHFMLDSVKSILERDKEFGRDALFAVLSKIEPIEFTTTIAVLLGHMIAGIDGVDAQSVLSFCSQSGMSLPAQVKQRLSVTVTSVTGLARRPEAPGVIGSESEQ